RISQLIVYQPNYPTFSFSNLNRLNDYFKITGVKYIFLNEQSNITQEMLSQKDIPYQSLREVRTDGTITHVCQVPWDTPLARLIDPKNKPDMHTFPFNFDLSSVTDQVTLDNEVHLFDKILA